MNTARWTYERRPDTRTTNVRMGMWLFLASEAMFFGSLFSAVVLLRAGATTAWAASGALDLTPALIATALLLAATLALTIAGTRGARPRSAALLASSVLAAAFVGAKLIEYRVKIEAGLHPATSVMLASWFALTGTHLAHVIGGIAANLWVAAGIARSAQSAWRERVHALRLYWYFVDLVWLVILISFYFL